MDDLLTSREDGSPSGQNLEYDPVFTAMELAARPPEERQVGDSFVSDDEPDYRDVAEKARAVLERSHDLRAAVVLAMAELRLRGLEGFAEVTTYIRRCLQEYWETCHPQLDADDDDDPTMRINAILGLADGQTVLPALKEVSLAEAQGVGRASLRDIAIAEGEISPPEGMGEVPSSALIQAVFTAADPAKLEERLDQARTIQGDLEAIDQVFAERTPGDGPELDPLIRVVRRIVGRLAEAVGVPADASGADADEAGGAPAAAGAAPSAPGTINSPRDVEAALDRIIQYYEKQEPSSPLPILLMRARRLVGADFVTIIKDIAPGGMDNVVLVGGIEQESGY